jgi:menaquinone-dependent protoporphyrinogen oxidase
MRVLVTAASKHGATAEIAEAIGRALAGSSLDVSVVRAEDVTTVAGFDAVVLGSGVYAGHWLEPARRIVDHHAGDLRERPVWLFSSGPIGDPPKPEPEESVDVADIEAAVEPREHRVFTGKIDKSVLGFAEKAILLAVRAGEGDYRDWQAIDAWAGRIAAELTAASGNP